MSDFEKFLVGMGVWFAFIYTLRTVREFHYWEDEKRWMDEDHKIKNDGDDWKGQ